MNLPQGDILAYVDEFKQRLSTRSLSLRRIERKIHSHFVDCDCHRNQLQTTTNTTGTLV